VRKGAWHDLRKSPAGDERAGRARSAATSQGDQRAARCGEQSESLRRGGEREHLTEAASEAGLERGKGVSQLVKRFNIHGLAALSITVGLRHKPTYTSEQHTRKLAEVQREAN